MAPRETGTAALVLGIVGILIPIFGIVASIFAVILGVRHQKTSSRALAGLILGVIGILVQLVVWVLVLIGALAYFGVLSPGVN